MAIRGADHGGLDGIDVAATNIWIHDVVALVQMSRISADYGVYVVDRGHE
jgi:hypothetical protein